MEPWASQTALCIHPQPFPSSRDPLSVVRAEDTALGQLQLPHHHKPRSGIFPDPPGQGRKGYLRRNRSISSMHWAAVMMESCWRGVQRAQYTVLWETQPCLGPGMSPLMARVAEGHRGMSETCHRTKRVLASPPEYTMPCCSGPV